MQGVTLLPAVEQARLLRARQLSAVELLDAHLERIQRLNPAVNAIVTLVPEFARERARVSDGRLARGEAGLLEGLPVAHKDLEPTSGIRTTMGSPVYATWVPSESSLLVERIQAAGAVTLGKTNTPEFGAGSQTFNPVFGATLNPYDRSRTCGGSSGGAAVALACGLVALADGSDMGGSLRNPASFCNVVGLRPTPGRVPAWPTLDPYSPLSVEGPMGRTVADAALLLAAMAGPDARCPLSLPEPGSVFAGPLDADVRGLRVAWSDDAGGLPVDRDVREALAPAREALAGLGCDLVDGFPDLTGAAEIFETLRAVAFELNLGPLYDERPGDLKEAIRWNVEAARRLSAADVGAATRAHAELRERVRAFLASVDALALPAVQVAPFPVELEYPPEVDGVPMGSYIEWMRSCSNVSVTGCPALSVPAGFTREGLPVGLQLVGRERDELGLLRLAHAFERAVPAGQRRPPLPA
ncbi:MAG: amidase [Thermoleophilia bacterium]|nr:amidase [Thermoleophilia bacterium]